MLAHADTEKKRDADCSHRVGDSASPTSERVNHMISLLACAMAELAESDTDPDKPAQAALLSKYETLIRSRADSSSSTAHEVLREASCLSCCMESAALDVLMLLQPGDILFLGSMMRTPTTVIVIGKGSHLTCSNVRRENVFTLDWECSYRPLHSILADAAPGVSWWAWRAVDGRPLPAELQAKMQLCFPMGGVRYEGKPPNSVRLARWLPRDYQFPKPTTYDDKDVQVLQELVPDLEALSLVLQDARDNDVLKCALFTKLGKGTWRAIHQVLRCGVLGNLIQYEQRLPETKVGNEWAALVTRIDAMGLRCTHAQVQVRLRHTPTETMNNHVRNALSKFAPRGLRLDVRIRDNTEHSEELHVYWGKAHRHEISECADCGLVIENESSSEQEEETNEDEKKEGEDPSEEDKQPTSEKWEKWERDTDEPEEDAEDKPEEKEPPEEKQNDEEEQEAEESDGIEIVEQPRKSMILGATDILFVIVLSIFAGLLGGSVSLFAKQ